MPNIDSYTNIIKNASPGESVRDAIINALGAINRIGGNVNTLEGHDISYFATAGEMNDMIYAINNGLTWEEDNKPHENSKHILTSGEIYDAINCVSAVLEDLNHYEIHLNDLVKNFEAIEKAKTKILDAIKAKSPGQFSARSGRDTSDFRKYEEYIRAINGSGTVTLKDISIDENHNGKTITADEEEEDTDPDHFYAYKKITTRVNHKTQTKSTSYNEVLRAQEGYVGFTKISVSQGSSTGSGRAGGVNGANTVDENGIADSYEITSNGSWSASSEAGVNGWRTVYVHVENDEIDADATYTVNFFDCDASGEKGEIIPDSSVEVPYNGSAQTPTPPTKPGLYFAGWNPSPSRIRMDTDCVAVYTDQAPSEGAISASWDEIVANRGTLYHDGQYKDLVLNDYGTIRMQKVASGEGCSSSTWVAMDILNANVFFNREHINEGVGGWSNSDLRRWLNGEFFNNALPEIVRDNIAPVEKVTYEFDMDYFSKFMSRVIDLVWVPSLTEILGDLATSETLNLANAYCDYLVDKQAISDNGYINWSKTGLYYPDYRYDFVMNEYMGTHYKNVYPTSTLSIYSDHMDVTRVPSDTSRLIKTKNGAASSWATRTATEYGRQANNNGYGFRLAGFTYNGEYTNMLGTGANGNIDDSSNNGIVIGFCL